MDEASRIEYPESAILPSRRRAWLSVRTVCLPYVLFGFAWVMFSDQLLVWLVPEKALAEALQPWKGVLFVLMTGSLLFLLTRSHLQATHRIMQRLKDNKQQFREMTERIREVFAVYDLRKQRFSYVAPGYATLWHRRPDSLLAQRFDWLRAIPVGERRQLLKQMRSAIRDGREISLECRVRRSDEPFIWVRLHLYPILDGGGQPLRLVILGEDISQEMAQQQVLHHQARHDPLTGLPNRRFLRERLRAAIEQHPEQEFVLLFLDLDRFKHINDSVGHTVGDDLLRQVAERLLGNLPASGFLARIGGDEFAVLLPAGVHVENTAQVLLQCIRQPFLLQHQLMYLSVSIGAASYPLDGDEPDPLLSYADMAMYAAKRQGRDLFKHYDQHLRAQTLGRIRLGNQLRQAVQEGALEVHYQPMYSLHTGQLSGAEALMRWPQPDGRLVPPAEFVPLLEDLGLIVKVTDWLLDESIGQLAEWQRRWPAFRMSVNLSAISMQDDHLLGSVVGTLQKYRVSGGQLELEVTESAFIRDPDKAARICATLKSHALRLAVDDFGTGYSSLIYLKRYAPDRVKIDKSFVSEILVSESDRALVASIIQLVHSLKMQVVAEGVESAEQLALLQGMGCDFVQGYLCGHAMPAAQWAHISPLLSETLPSDSSPAGQTLAGR